MKPLFLLRHLLAIAVLPFVVTIVIPVTIARQGGTSLPGPESTWLPLQIGGAALLAAGVLLFIATLWLFATRGRGTLAPWDPPTQLVVHGPYRFVRNPMISGVILILFGESAWLHSTPHLVWAVIVTAINAIYIPLLEEPQLLERFGDSYREYCGHVPRIIPRLTPWSQ